MQEHILAQQMLPQDANPYGDVHGGAVMKLVDTCGALAAVRHARSRVVTAVMDSMTFEAPVQVGNVVHLRACLTWTGRTSMEVKVVVEAEDVLTGRRRITSEAFLVYVALDEEGRPKPIPPFTPSSQAERADWEGAQRRREARLASRRSR
ncbi:MAG TPA: acyl-CoA thioesterase [Chloroflexota bacterium]|jgi:acyl-CoA hydrolase